VDFDLASFCLIGLYGAAYSVKSGRLNWTKSEISVADGPARRAASRVLSCTQSGWRWLAAWRSGG